MQIYFVTEKYIKDETPIGENVDIKKVLPWIKTAALMRVRRVLGKDLFADLLTKYNAQTLSADEKDLVEQIQPVVAWYAASMSLPSLNSQPTNKGQQKQRGDYSENAGSEEEVKAQDTYTVTGRMWLNDLIDFLKDNGSKYPLYPENCGCGSVTKTDPNGFNDSFIIV